MIRTANKQSWRAPGMRSFWQETLLLLIVACAASLAFWGMWRLSVESEDDDPLTTVASFLVWLTLLGTTAWLLGLRC